MSHVVGAGIFVTNLNHAEAVAPELGFQLVRDVTSHAGYPGSDTACEHKLRRIDHVDGMYEIGLRATTLPNGGRGWELRYDNWGYMPGTAGKAVEEKAGVGLVKFKQALASHGLVEAAARQGYRVQRYVNPAGEIHITASRG